MRTLAIANMEVGSVWMRLVRVRGGAPSVFLMKPSAVSSSSKTTRTIRYKNHLSTFFPSSNPPPITFLSPVSPTRRPLSTATCSPQIPLATIEDYCSDAGGHACVYTRGGDNINVLPKKGSRVLLKGMSFTELQQWVRSHAFRPGQALMLWKRLYGDDIWAHCTDELEGLNKDFKKMLSEHAEFRALSLKDILTSSDGTRKGQDNCLCFKSSGMRYELMGLKRHLTAAEIVEQAVFARRLLSSEVGSITNVVFMGMGEPLHNVENVIKAANIMVHEQGLHFSPRKVTVSTSGLVPQLKQFLNESNCALAVSLNATTDEVRNWIMPINRKYKLGLLIETLREELRFKNNYKVLFEYVMLAGVNDSFDDAKRLIGLVQGIPCKINLISFNPHCGSQFTPTTDEKMIEFRNILAGAGCTVFLRLSRGDDQMAACGQLGNPGAIQAPLLRVPEKFQTAINASI
ncbi:Radical SAM domain-containing protein [Citrus sinensis]|uniref:Radical SAM domain-containing protein n=1 Tax=Citrus sinensis TaxID=2711 RepID=A0ACB8LIP0_CITSI|nr:Radical SAM domain-containing protein [Citrus sinensis]